MNKDLKQISFAFRRSRGGVRYHSSSKSFIDPSLFIEKEMFLPRESLHFFAISDFGIANRNIRRVAAAMNQYATDTAAPDFITGLGDNFYPTGVRSKYDPQFDACWRNIFLQYPQLRVPWRMVLGNHDYMGLPQEQIQYHYDAALNKEGLWYMPNNNYIFSYDLIRPDSRKDISSSDRSEGGSRSSSSDSTSSSDSSSSSDSTSSSDSSSSKERFSIKFYVLDTNGCQGHVRVQWPRSATALRDYIENLHQALKTSTADWNIVLGHHPMYTQGAGHGPATRSLRSTHFTRFSLFGFAYEYRGYGLEDVLVDGAVQAYFTGHEHVFQYHSNRGVHNFICGASGADQRNGTGLYGGVSEKDQLDWVAGANDIGFVAVEIKAEYMTVRFITDELEVLKEIHVPRNCSALSS